jgi:hypothetical protein
MTNYRIHIAYVINSKQENKHCYERLKYNLKDYNIQFNSNYINFKRGNLITNRSINFDTEYTNLLDIIQKIPRDYIFIYLTNVDDDHKIIYDHSDIIRTKHLNEEEVTIVAKIKEKINTNQQEFKYIEELEMKISNIEKEIIALEKRIIMMNDMD